MLIFSYEVLHMNKNEIFKYTIIAVLICVLVFIIPLLMVNRYLNVNNTGALGITFKDLYESNLTNEQQTHLTILRKSSDYNLDVMKTGFSIMFVYFVAIISMILLLSSIALMKEHPNRFKVYLCLFFALIIGIFAFIIAFPNIRGNAFYP